MDGSQQFIEWKMKDILIAYCGLNCGTCQARIATLKNDDELRKEVSRKWCELNQTDQITPETINCLGCRADGVKFVYCDSMCEIRKCAMSKGYETCFDCPSRAECKKIENVIV